MTSVSGCAFFTAERTSSPLPPPRPSMRSVTTTSNSRARSFSIAEAASWATSTLCPARLSSTSRNTRMECSASTTRRRAMSRTLPRRDEPLRSICRWKRNRERAALPRLALDADAASMRFHHAMDDGEPEAGAPLLGGEEGVEYAGEVFGRNPGPGIGHGKDRLPSRPLQGNRDVPARGGGIRGVAEQVPEDLLELRAIGAQPATGLGFHRQGDGETVGLGAEELGRFQHQVASVNGAELGRGWLGEGEEVADERFQTLPFLANDLQEPALTLDEPRRTAQQLDRPRHRGERVADLVRETRGESAHHREPIGAAHRLFHAPELGQVLE